MPNKTIINGVIENILNVISANSLTNAVALGHTWGKGNVLPVLNLGDISATDEQEGYEVVFLAELLWKDTYPLHRNLLESLSACLNSVPPCQSHLPQPDSLIPIFSSTLIRF